MFNKKGTSEKILKVIKGIDKTAKIPVLCSNCKKELDVGYHDDFITEVGSTDSKVTIIAGKTIIECKSCGHKNIV